MMKTLKEAKDFKNFRKCAENSLFKLINQKTKIFQLTLTFQKIPIQILVDNFQF